MNAKHSKLSPAALALSLQGLAVQLGGRTVLQGIDLQLQAGQTLALLGPSGCGKTTLLRCLAGLVTAQAGQVHIAGRDVAGLPPQARGIGMMFQNYALFPNLSVRGNISFGPLAQGWSAERAASRTQELLALIELQAQAEQHPGRLSGGQRQRVALARALAPQPALLLMDEPFSAIDESFRLPLRRAFRRLQQALSQTCVLVTHDREEAFELADQVAVMLDGRLARVDTPAGLLRQPGTLGVARFLGVHNVFSAEAVAVWSAVGDPPALPGPGPWVAAMSSLQPLAEAAVPAAPGWVLQATVRARFVGLHGVQLELLDAAGGLLQAREGGTPLAVGHSGRWWLPASALTPLAAV